MSKFYLFYSYLFIYFIQGRSENHFCENPPCLKMMMMMMMIIIIIIIMAVKTSGCPDILNNDWAASRSQSMQVPVTKF